LTGPAGGSGSKEGASFWQDISAMRAAQTTDNVFFIVVSLRLLNLFLVTESVVVITQGHHAFELQLDRLAPGRDIHFFPGLFHIYDLLNAENQLTKILILSENT